MASVGCQIRRAASPARHKREPGHGVRLPGRPDQGRSLQDPYDPDRKRHPVPLSALRPWPDGEAHDTHVRHALPRERHRASLHQDQPSLDDRAGRADRPQAIARSAGQARMRPSSAITTMITLNSNGTLPTSSPPAVSGCSFGRRLKTLKGLTPYEHICKGWTSEPRTFRLDPIQKMPGLNSCIVWKGSSS